MAWRCGNSLSRSLISTARGSSSSLRPSPALPRIRSPPLAAPRLQQRGFSFAHPRSLGELGCTQSLLPLHSVVATPRLTLHLSFDSRACCELSQGS
ncbi:protein NONRESPONDING TO OXYLIPINS 2, mitochondrial-like [Tasmannia lanceolata]|uniref:protein NONRESPONDING TO OXYLIPINS 2, mitochondrial-like n=1 Tax=Tasmannia lanceolata TaxID=3420 RepID=UPI0040636C46